MHAWYFYFYTTIVNIPMDAYTQDFYTTTGFL
jgi:hypothetical protein